MYITYRDALGVILVAVNEYGIAFGDGYAYFSDAANRDYRVSVADIVEIREGM